MSWISTRFPGVRYREHPTRKHGVQSDLYYTIRFQVDGKRYNEALGWASEGWSAKKAYLVLADLKENAKLGKGLTSLKEKRELASKAKTEETERREKAERDNLTFGQFFLSTFFPKAIEDKRPTTWKTERAYFKHWISPVIGEKPFTQVGVIDLERIKRNMTRAGRAPKTVADCLGLVRHVFNEASRRGMYAGSNPVSLIKLPKQDNQRIRFLSWGEAARLLEALSTRSSQLHDISLLSLYCGLRAGEIFNLTWNDVDLGRGHLFIKDPKSGRNRYAYLTSKASDMLLNRFAGKYNNNDYVFTARSRKKIAYVSNLFEKVVRELGFNEGVSDARQRVVFHTLRHTFASWLAEAGVDLYAISTLLGHRSIAMTQRYSHLGENSLRMAVARLEQPNETGVKIHSIEVRK